MNRNHKYLTLFATCIYLFYSGAYAAETINGKITAVGNGQVIVEISDPATGQAYPVKGDKVTFFVEIVGLDELIDSGSGVVANADGKTITVTETDQSPPLEAIVKILATGIFQSRIQKPVEPAIANITDRPTSQSLTAQVKPSRRSQQIPLKELKGLNDDSLRRIAESGNPEAMLALGNRLLSTDGVLALSWLEKAERTGSIEAKIALAKLFQRGSYDGKVRYQIDRATVLYREAAEQGSAEAMYQLGKILDVLSGYLDKDSRFDMEKHPQREALEWYKKSLAIKRMKHVEKAYQELENRKFRVGRFEMFAPPGFQVEKNPVAVILKYDQYQKDVFISLIYMKGKRPPGNARRYIDKVKKKALRGQKKQLRDRDIDIYDSGPAFKFRNGEFLVTSIASFYAKFGRFGPLMHIIYLDKKNGDIYQFIFLTKNGSLYDGRYWSDYVQASMVIYD